MSFAVYNSVFFIVNWKANLSSSSMDQQLQLYLDRQHPIGLIILAVRSRPGAFLTSETRVLISSRRLGGPHRKQTKMCDLYPNDSVSRRVCVGRTAVVRVYE